MTARKSKHGKRVGRPPAGAEGERVKDYPQLSLRVPPKVKKLVYALGVVREEPQWRVVSEAIARALEALPRRDQRRVQRLVNRPATLPRHR